MSKKIFLLISFLLLINWSCKKEDEVQIENEGLTIEDNLVIDNLPAPASFDSKTVVLPNGELLSEFFKEADPQFYNQWFGDTKNDYKPEVNTSNFNSWWAHYLLIAKISAVALNLTDRKKHQYPKEGENMPAQNGIGYCYGGKNYKIRRSPSSSSCTYKIHGLDCSGFIHQLLLNSAGINSFEGLNAENQRKPENIKGAIISKIPELSNIVLGDMGAIPPSKFMSGDIIYWVNSKNIAKHIGIILKNAKGELAIFQSNGDSEDCDKNISTTRGPRYYDISAYNKFSFKYGGIVRIKAVLPILITSNINNSKNSKSNSIQTGGEISYAGNSNVKGRGVCWSTQQFPTILDNKTIDGAGLGAFTSSITGLQPNTMYYIRSYATNSDGTSYGNMITYTQLNGGGTAVDIDGNIYKTVVIGNQEWFAENLKTTKYNDGSSIPNITDNAVWEAQGTGAYCWYNNDINNKATYGALYNWYTVVDSRKLCPTGWHVPSDAEWTTLENYLGGSSVAGGKLKATIMWNGPNTGATDEFGFSVLPGGYRSIYGGGFCCMGTDGVLWTSTKVVDPYSAWIMGMSLSYQSFVSHLAQWPPHGGLGVRCLRNY